MTEVIEDTRFACAECLEWYEGEVEATECCPSGITEFTVYVCSLCGNEYTDVSTAAECCEEEEDD